MTDVTLIHPFRVSLDQENDFLKAWERVDQYMKEQPGFIDTKLHKSLDFNNLTAFSFINVARWENAGLFQNAISNENFLLLAKPVLEFSCGPGLYEIYKE